MNSKRTFFLTSIATVLLLPVLTACSGSRPAVQPAASQPIAVQPEARTSPVEQPAPDCDGSLWPVSGDIGSLFVDTKARRVGDIVTVQVEESSSATNEANTETGRGSSLEAGIDKLFGLETWWPERVLDKADDDLPKINPFGNPSVKGSLNSSFDGSGKTTRKGDLTAYITCRVTDVMPNGNLRIVGSREVLVNHETQLIILSGVIRPRDIDQDNTILSTFVADAKIAYSGSGIIDDRQRPGWLANMLDSLWPF
jgi:flagellar L-ring protein precursor FlgH